MMEETMTLYRPVGEKELAKIIESGYKEFPPRFPSQPIFYPVLNEEYASMIARDWNARDGKKGYVTKFLVRADFAEKYEIHVVGSSICQELWVPADELEEFNKNIVGEIEAISEFQ